MPVENAIVALQNKRKKKMIQQEGTMTFNLATTHLLTQLCRYPVSQI